jgi:membrane protease subunit (stomatin/prohibitin family)
VRLNQFLDQQPIDVIQWNEPEPGILAHRYPMLDMEIQTGATLRVREAEMAVFVDQGRVADVFGPGVHRLNAASLPLLAERKSWDAGFQSPFHADVYFFSMRGEIDQRWGSATPITLHDAKLGAMPLRGYGVYSYRIADVRDFFMQVSGTRESYFLYDLDDRLRRTIVARVTDVLAASGLSCAELMADAAALSGRLVDQIAPAFAALGLELSRFSVQSLSLPEGMQRSPEGAWGWARGSVSDVMLRCVTIAEF